MHKRWCFLGAKNQGILAMRTASHFLGPPEAVVFPSNLGNEDFKLIRIAANEVGANFLSKTKGFELLRKDSFLDGLVCRFDIIPNKLLTRPNRFLNIHNSLLPRWRGVHPLQWALLEGDDEAGITYHLCKKEVDSGEIVFQSEFPISPDDTINHLFEKAENLTKKCTVLALKNWLSGRIIEKKTSHGHPYAKRLSNEIQDISSSCSPFRLHRISRISQPPWPRAFFRHKGDRVEINRVIFAESQSVSLTDSEVSYGSFIVEFEKKEQAELFREFMSL